MQSSPIEDLEGSDQCTRLTIAAANRGNTSMLFR
jgi:hypothetical protein